MEENKEIIDGVAPPDDAQLEDDGTQDWDRYRDLAITWMGHGSRIQAIALLQDRNALLEYVGDDEEKVMQWIGDNLDADCPNEYMIGDLGLIVDDWAMKKIKAKDAVEKILTTLDNYIGGC
jgi:hypothetical protein